MRTVVDISEPGAAYGDDARLPDPTVITDDGDIVLCFGDVEIRMTLGQFEDLYQGMRTWRRSIPAVPSLTIYEEGSCE